MTHEPLTSEDAAESSDSITEQQVRAIPEQRRVLLDALRERDSRLAEIYQAAVRLVDAVDVPDRLSLTAHAMRELMERLPVAFDVPVQEKWSVINAVRELERDLARAQERSSCRTTTGWEGQVDAPLAKLLQAVEKLAADRQANWSSRTEVAVELMNQLEPALGRRSPSLVKPEATTWAETRRYFEQVSHHHHFFDAFETDSSALEERIRTVEILLLNKLRPQTVSDFREIDTLMNQFTETTDE